MVEVGLQVPVELMAVEAQLVATPIHVESQVMQEQQTPAEVEVEVKMVVLELL